MGADVEVTYSVAALKRAGIVGGGQLLQLQTKADAEPALAAYADAVAQANAAMHEAEREELYAQLNAPVPTPGGPAAFVRDCEPTAALERMLELLSTVVRSHGISGRLVAVKPIVHRRFDNVSLPTLSAGFLLSVDQAEFAARYDPAKRRFDHTAWCVPDDTTRAYLETALPWVLEVGGTVRVSIGEGSVHVDAEHVVELLTQTLSLEPQVSVMSTPDDDHMRVLQFGLAGWAAAGAYEPTPRAAQLDDLLDLLSATASTVDASFVRASLTHYLLTRETVFRRMPPSAWVGAQGNPGAMLALYLQADYVHDAHVSQVMTSAQLARTHDLDASRWSVQQVDADRHLVTATDPAPWLEGPSDDVISQARSDFGEAILTPATLAAHPQR